MSRRQLYSTDSPVSAESPLLGTHMRTFSRKTPPLAIGLTLLALLLGASGCNHPGTDTSTAAILRWGLGGEPSNLDPAHASGNFSTEGLRDHYDGLTTEWAVGEVIPGVAASWTVDPTGTESTFHLGRDARRSNGSQGLLPVAGIVSVVKLWTSFP